MGLEKAVLGLGVGYCGKTQLGVKANLKEMRLVEEGEVELKIALVVKVFQGLKIRHCGKDELRMGEGLPGKAELKQRARQRDETRSVGRIW